MSIEPLSFAPLSDAALEEFSDARNFVADVAARLVGGQLMQSELDLPTLQAIVDDDAMKTANFEAWVALGIAFGDALTGSIPGLIWRIVTDKTGAYAALQFFPKAISIAAPTMLWKRVERGENIDLAFLAQEVRELIEDAAPDAKVAEPVFPADA